MRINKESYLHVQMFFSLNSVLTFFLVIALKLLHSTHGCFWGAGGRHSVFLALLLGVLAALQLAYVHLGLFL